MNNFLRFLLVFLLATNSIFAQSDCTPIPEVNFPGGRVVLSFDGNFHDDDDIVAMAYSAGMWWAAGLQDKVVQIEYSNHVCSLNEVESDGVGPGKGDDSQNMRTTASGTISNFGYNAAIFYDYERSANASTNKMAAEIEKSTASNPLWIIAGGPMETIWRGLEKATKGHGNVTIISHSKWNQDHLHCNGAHNWTSLKNKYQSKGTFFVENCRSGNCSGTTELNDQNGGFSSAISNWTWMQNSSKAYNRWIFGRNPFSSKFDPSDAGMSYFLITGGPFNGGNKTPNHNDARKLMENPCLKQNAPPTGSAPILTITSPSQGQTFEIGENVAIQLSASDDGGIVKHQIFINNSLVDTDGSTYTPHNLKILTTESYIVRAEVTDNSGTKSVQTATISGKKIGEDDKPAEDDKPVADEKPVEDDKTVPVSEPTAFNIVSPIDGEVFSAGETITVDLSSTGNTNAQHKVYVDGRLVDTDGANFTPHRITNSELGSYTIKAEVIDTNGKISAKTIVVTVTNTGQPKAETPTQTPSETPSETPTESGSPDFNFVSLSDKQNFNTGANIVVNLAPNGNTNNIVKHEIFVNDKLVDTDGANFTAHTITNPSNGTFTIKAKVTNGSGASTVKSVVVNVGSANSANPTNSTEDSNAISLSVSPVNGQVIDTGDRVTIDLSANSDKGSIVKHQIFINNKLVDTDGIVYTPYIVENISSGIHQIRVDVTDDKSNTKSQTIQIEARSKSSVSLVARLPSTNVDTRESDTLERSVGNEERSFRIAQNPVQSANLQVYVSERMKLTVLNLHGVVVKEITDAKEKVDLNVSGWAPGVYILKSAKRSAKFIIPPY